MGYDVVIEIRNALREAHKQSGLKGWVKTGLEFVVLTGFFTILLLSFKLLAELSS
jgi:hypothetical protein